MKKLKKIMLSLVVLALMIPLSIGLAACGDKGKTELDAGGNATEESPIVQTWLFDTNPNMITHVYVEVGKVSIRLSGFDSVTGATKYKTVVANGGGESSVTVNTDNFEVSDNNAETGNVYNISGSLNGDGNLVITGTITVISGYISSQVNVSLTSKGPA